MINLYYFMKLIFGVHAVEFYNLAILYHYILRNLQKS